MALTNEQCIVAKIEYEGLFTSGMMWEIFPECTGDWLKDQDLWFKKFEEEILPLRKKKMLPHVCWEHQMIRRLDGWEDFDLDTMLDIQGIDCLDIPCPRCVHGKQTKLFH